MTATDTPVGKLGIDDIADAEPDDLRLWSVTSIIGCLDKPALLYWAAEQTATTAINSEATWRAMLHDRGEQEAVKWLRDARFRKPKGRLSATSLGTCAHAACEEYAITGVRPDHNRLTEIIRQEGGARFDGVDNETPVLERMLDRFDEWLQRFTPTYTAVETVVYNPTYGYAGQADAFLTIDGVRFLGDYKSSREGFDSRGQAKTPYPEQVGIQLAAYANAEFAAAWRARRIEQFRRRYYVLNDAERVMAVPVPEVDSGLVIQLTPDHCEAFPIDCGPAVFEAFLFTQEAFRWVNQTSKNVMGMPLVPGGAS